MDVHDDKSKSALASHQAVGQAKENVNFSRKPSSSTIGSYDPGADEPPAGDRLMAGAEPLVGMQDRRLAISDRLGTFAIVTIVLGWIVEAAVLSFLAYIWSGRGSDPGGGYASQFWRSLMLRDLAARTATLSALVLRTAADLQATVCTALVAALMMEARDVEMANIALFSILRAVNGGPSSIAQPLFWTPKKFVKSAPAFMILLLLLASIAVQFSSTLLLSDFRQTSLLSDPIAKSVSVIETFPELLFDPTNFSGATTLAWHQALTSFPTFAEDGSHPVVINGDLGDSRHVRRALLPFKPQDRAKLRRYNGAAMTCDSQVTCVRPSLTASITNASSGNPPLQRINGTLSLSSTGNGTGVFDFACTPVGGCIDIPFDCALPYFSHDGSDLQSILSKVPTSVCLFNESSSQGFRSFTNLFMVLDTVTTFSDWQSVLLQPLPDPTDHGEWSSFTFRPGVTLNVTVCQSDLSMDLEAVSLEGMVDPIEPTMNYEASNATWSTDDILRLMGIGEVSLNTERGILNLTNSSRLSDDELTSMFRASPNFETFSTAGSASDLVDQYITFLLYNVKGGILTATGPSNYSIYFCTQCVLDGNMTDPHPYYPILFHAILNETGSAAVAWQAMMFWLAQGQYYNSLPGFDFGDNSTIVFSQAASIPQVWNGLGSVIGIILLDMVCVAVITWMYLHRTRYSVYGNAWHAVAQVLSPDTRHLLDRATQATDEDVKQSLRETGTERVNAGLCRLDTGRIAVLRRTSPSSFKSAGID